MKSNHKRLTLEITKKFHNSIKEAAKKEDKTMKQWVMETLAEKMNRISAEENENI